MPFGFEALLIPVIVFIVWIAITVVITRWILRINVIIDRLDKIVTLLEGKE